tara:strand:- start:1603 stop:1950 length:348 start_codon:yes stop_codon:yes gene_type:complete
MLESIHSYLLIWKHNIIYSKLEEKITLLEKRLKWEHMKYTTYRKECDIKLINKDYNVCDKCNSYIYPLNIEEWLNVDITEYDDILKYENYGLVEGENYLGIGKSQILLSCVCETM